jgi:carbon storage regulator CsrA
MLLLSRSVGQSVYLFHGGVKIRVTVVEIRTNSRRIVRLGFEAPQEVRILRDDAKNQGDYDE